MSKDLQMKILSFLPTVDAVKTSSFLKAWQFLWMYQTRLEFDDTDLSQFKCESLSQSINKNLPLHFAKELESFSLKISNQQFFQHGDIINWVEQALARSVRELSIECTSDCLPKEHTILESSLYTCKSLVSLKLQGLIYVEVPSSVCLPALKILVLRRLGIESIEALQLIVSSCPILEDLTMEHYVFQVNQDRNERDFNIKIPTLKRLSVCLSELLETCRVVIVTPSLKYFKVSDCRTRSFFAEKMLELEEANIWVDSLNDELYLRAITSVKRLMLCLKDSYVENVIAFEQLEHLMICTCDKNWGYIVSWLLKGLRKLQVLKLEPFDGHFLESGGSAGWEEPSIVPECFVESLKTFKWRKHDLYADEFDLGRYVLENACCLKNATIVADSKKQLDMITNELSFFPLASAKCELELYSEEIVHDSDSDSDDDDDDDDDDYDDDDDDDGDGEIDED